MRLREAGNRSVRELCILQVGTSDFGGGAERSALNLHQAYQEMGHESWLAVGYKRSKDPGILQIPNEASRNAWVRCWDAVRLSQDCAARKVPGLGRLSRTMKELGEPRRWIENRMGVEDFNYPGTCRLYDLVPGRPDIVHLHNLHGGYFDLRELPKLSAWAPTILNVRDAWLASGHCAYSFDCRRWLDGCGNCPDLGIYPAIERDATARNWRRKRDIFRQSRVYITAPSQWLMDYMKRSIVAACVVGERVIPNGVDTSIFKPCDRAAARDTLSLGQDAFILSITASGIKSNAWKDYGTLRKAVEILAARERKTAVLVLAIGDTGPDEFIGNVRIKFVPHVRDTEILVRYYSASDLYVHAAKVESFGNVLIEARACGTPVVATAVGGIPEHVAAIPQPYRTIGTANADLSSADGILTPVGDAEALANSIEWLMTDTGLRGRLSINGLRRVREGFTVERQAEHFLNWYQQIILRNKGGFNELEQTSRSA